ncbi:hypothetical protein PPQ74_004866, partial [Salmonella enterica]|nr:hypothetical protein [Salmonella enterica]
MSLISDEKVFSYIYRTLQSKLVHVQYTAEKAVRLRKKMTASAVENQQIAERMAEFINRLYSLRGRIKTKIPSLGIREKRYGNQIVSLFDDLMKVTTEMQGSVSRSA